MTNQELNILLLQLVKEGKECEWVEFKLNFHSPEEIGERISALSNSACLLDQQKAYLIYGIRDGDHSIVGTTFKPSTHKHKNEDVERWLAQRLSPRIDFRIYEFQHEGKNIVIFEIPSAVNQPVSFINIPYIRIGSTTTKLQDYSDKARKIWKKDTTIVFEMEYALTGLTSSDIIRLLDTQYYFELTNLPYPTTQDNVIEKLTSEKFIVKGHSDYSITNLGGLLFAKNFDEFPSLSRRAIRVIVYKGKNKLETLKDQFGRKGYAVGFKGLVDYINDNLPQNEEISKMIRETVRMYPADAVRELVANAIIHQDFEEEGFPLVEIYSDRIEISNPGLPLIKPLRFIDDNQSRNPTLANSMRKLGICEEKGSGFDRVVARCEVFQLPAPDIFVSEKHTKVIMYAHQKLNEMDRKDKIRACYQHCCLRYVSNEKMTNQSVRERFQIEEKNSALASRIISDTKEEDLIKDEDPESKSYKYARYIPFWA